jgi:LacI family transcriptional regulator
MSEPGKQDKRKRVTLADIAARAGVNRSTVSRVLNGHTGNFSVLPEVRERIQTAARDLGYQGNPLLRSLRAKQTFLIQLLGIPDPMPETSGDLTIAVPICMRMFQERGYTVIASFRGLDDGQAAMQAWNPVTRVDGLILAATCDPRVLAHVDAQEIPYVMINGDCGRNGVAVRLDDAGGTRLALEHFYDLGHRRIAYLPSRWRGDALSLQHYSVHQREETYRAFCRERNLPTFEPVDPPYQPGQRDTLLAGFMRYLQRERVTAVLAYCHNTGIQCLHAATLLGIQVPRELSLLCFNDLSPMMYRIPRMSAIKTPDQEMGWEAGKLLKRLMATGLEQPLEDRVLVLPETLSLHETTAPPPDMS